VNFTIGYFYHAEHSITAIAQTVLCPPGDEYFVAGSNFSHLIAHLHLAAVREHDPQLIEILMRLQASSLSGFHLDDPYRTRLVSCVFPVSPPGTFDNAWAISHALAPLVQMVDVL
jgi:hypothetical protein